MARLILVALLAIIMHECSAIDCEMEFRCHDNLMNQKINDQIEVEMTGHYTYLYMAQLFDHHSRHLPKVAKYFRQKSAEELGHAERFIQYQNQRGGIVEMTGASRYGEGSCASVTNVKEAFKCAMELEARVTRALTQLHQDASSLKFNEDAGAIANCDALPQIQPDDLRLTQPILVTVGKTKGGNAHEETTSDYTKCTCRQGETNCHVISYSYVELADMIVHEFLDHQLEDTKEIANYYNTLKNMYGVKADHQLESWLFDQHLEL